MSVINQMLKDLDKRQKEQHAGSNTSVAIPTKNNNSKIIIIIVTAIILINIAAIMSWRLYTENQQLRSQSQLTSIDKKIAANNNIDATNKDADNSSNVVNTDNITSSANKKTLVTSANAKISSDTKVVSVDSTIPKVSVDNKTQKQLKEQPQQENISTTHVNVDRNKTVITPVNKKPTLTRNEQKKHITNENTTAKAIPTKPSFTISRKQLSPQQLAAKKIKQAEKAIDNNQLAKAESLFEEVLLLTPSHQSARKQLAALWYGKQAYQDAINVLSQGIVLEPLNEEMRLMTAKIYLEQRKKRQALNILAPVDNSNQVNVQALLASTAAELNEYNIAIKAYEKLLSIEPKVSRWWLGIAVTYDTKGSFSLASNAYKKAIEHGSLSSNSLKFARKRVSELGE